MKTKFLLHKQVIYGEELNLSYSKLGNSDNIILCIHGIVRNSRDFDYLAAKLAPNYTVICIDIFGRGNSSLLKDKKKYNYNTYYHALIALLKSLKIKKISLLGTSMGGIIAMYIAANNIELVKKIVLNDIGPAIDLDALRKLAVYLKKYPSFSNKTEAKNYLKMFLSPLKLSSDKLLSHIVEHSITIGKDGNYYLNYDPAIGEKFDQDVKSMSSDMNLWGLWEKINQPVLILHGEKSEILTNDTVKKMIDGRNNVDYIKYEDVGHTPSLMEDKQILDVLKWLNTGY
ncbi:MAG: alpha/beta hydrolase [Rickettsiaceae bacterium H1]|nr:alpha/beta hydrolase [Rickettsiaceae bacterium H1]